MSVPAYLIAIDQGTSSSRTVVFGADAQPVASAQKEFPQEYPKPGWVEHDPEAIWRSVIEVTRDALEQSAVETSSFWSSLPWWEYE